MGVEEHELARNLGFTEAMTLGGGTMIGAGIFILPGIAAENAGPASSISFIVAGFVALLAALTLSELATGMPVAGGSYHFVNRALGSFFGNIVGWGVWTGLMFASAFYMIGFGQYIVEPIPFLDGRALVVGFGVLGLIFLVGVNYYGTEESSRFQNIMIGSETLVIIVFVIAGLFYIDTTNLDPFAPTGPSGILATTGIVFITFLGFEIIATVAEEVENPGKTIPLTMVLSVVLVTMLYASVMIVSTGVVPFQELGASLVPVSDVAAVSMGSIGVVAIVGAAAIAAISSSNSSILSAARVVFAMGRDELMSDQLNEIHGKFRTPHRAIVVTGAVTFALILLGLQVDAIIELLAEVASFSFLISYMLVHIAMIVYRRAGPDDYQPDFKLSTPLYPLVPLLGIVLSLVVISQMETIVILLGTGIVSLAILWYFGYSRSRVSGQALLGDAIAYPPEEPADTSDSYTVVVPVVNPETQKTLLRLAAATAQSHTEADIPEIVAVNVLRVPSQTALEQKLEFEEERVERQRELLESARSAAEELDVNLRTRAMIGRDIPRTLLNVIEEEEADQVLLGWRGQSRRRDFLFGSTIDPILKNAVCEVSLVHLKREEIGRPVVLAGPGPHAPVAARRASEFGSISDRIPVLLNVQPPSEDPEIDPYARGEKIIRRVAEEAGLAKEDYEPQVIVNSDIESTILKALGERDTVFVGVSEKLSVSRIMFGSLADRIGEHAKGNVVFVRSEYEHHLSVREAIVKRLPPSG